MSQEQFRLREPEVAADLDLLAKHWDMCMKPLEPISVYAAEYKKLRSLRITQWGGHQIVNNGPRFKRQRKVTEALV